MPAREGIPVYRCGDNHWHFIPNKRDLSFETRGWYRFHIEPEKGTFKPAETVYVQGCGSEQFKVDSRYKSGFCTLKDSRGDKLWCPGKYRWTDRMMWREEELARSVWGGRADLPTYEEVAAYEEASSAG